jgi:hypothetical protein
MKPGNMIFGAALIVIGVLLILTNLDIITIDFRDLWPWIITLVGIAFWIGYFNNRANYGLLMPGTILVVYGVYFYYESINFWRTAGMLWPVYLLGPGLGFFAMYYFGPREKGLLVAGAVNSGIALFFLLQLTSLFQYWPVLLIILGALLLWHSRKNPGY